MSFLSILIIKPSSLGDIVHTLPAVHFLKTSFPSAEIRWIANSEWVPLLDGNPDLHHVISLPRQGFQGAGGVFRFLTWSRGLSSLRPNLVLDFQGLMRSAWMSQCSKGDRILGLSDAREGAGFFYHDKAQVHTGQHSVDRYLALAKLAGATIDGPVSFPLPTGQPLIEFKIPANMVLLHPFARGVGKSLTPKEISELTRLLAPLPVIIIGKSEEQLILNRNAVSLVNQTSLSQLVWLIRKAAFVISVDSGPMHIAAALTSQLLSIHTWSDPKQVGPYNPSAWVWKRGEIIEVRSIPKKHFPTATTLRPDLLQVATFLHERVGHF